MKNTLKDEYINSRMHSRRNIFNNEYSKARIRLATKTKLPPGLTDSVELKITLFKAATSLLPSKMKSYFNQEIMNIRENIQESG